MNGTVSSTAAPLRRGSVSRPMHVSRATGEITQFPSYEAMHQLSSSPPARHSATLFAALAPSKISPTYQSSASSRGFLANQFVKTRHSSTSTNQLSSSSSASNAELTNNLRGSSGPLDLLASFIPGIPGPRPRRSQGSPAALLNQGESPGGGEPGNQPDRTLNKSSDPEDQSQDPDQSIARLLPLTLSLLSCNLVFTVLGWYGIPFLIKLDLSTYSKTILWLASPISGLLVPPILATISDLNYESPHRRRAWILGSSLMLFISLFTLSFCQPIGRFITYLVGADQGDWDPERALHVQSNSIAIGIISFYVAFLALDALSLSSRSLILDQISAINQNLVNVWAGRMAHLGNLVGFTIVTFSEAPHGPQEPHLLRCLVAYTVPLLVITSSLTIFTQTERPPSKYDRRPSPNTCRQLFKFFKQFITSLPVPIRRVCYVQVFSSICWLTIIFHAKSLVSRFTLMEFISNGRTITEPLIRHSERQGTKVMLKFSFLSLASSFILPFICSFGKTNYVTVKEGRNWNRVRKFLTIVTPRNVWTISFVGYVILMCFTFGIHSSNGASAFVVLLGVPWAVAQWVPFALLMEYTRSIEETPPQLLNPLPPSPSITRIRRASVAATTPPYLNKVESRAHERTSLLSSPTTAGLAEESLPCGQVQAATFPVVGGIIRSTRNGASTLAAHDMATVAPHFLVSIVTSIMFEVAYFVTAASTTTTSNTLQSFSSTFENAEEGPNDLLWLFRLTIISALIAICLSRKIVVPTSELEYWDELEYQIYESERRAHHNRGFLLEDAG